MPMVEELVRVVFGAIMSRYLKNCDAHDQLVRVEFEAIMSRYLKNCDAHG